VSAIAIFALLFFASYFDLKKREIPGYLTALAWIFAAFVFDTKMLALMFGVVFFIMSILDTIWKDVFGMGDILWAPIVFSFYPSLPEIGFVSLLAISFFLLYVIFSRKKGKVKPAPFVLFMFLALIALAASKATFLQ
jgi:hypothetical protein